MVDVILYLCMMWSHLTYMLGSWSVMIFPWMKLHIHFVPCDLQEMMTTVNQGMSVEEIERLTPTITGQMANSVALVAFGSIWTIMVVVTLRTQQLRSVVMFLLLVPYSVSSASILSLVRLLLVLIVLRGVIQLPLVLSLAYNKSVDLFFLSFGLAY
nr:hypothetical protein [Tanacetum cinerariifolium]